MNLLRLVTFLAYSLLIVSCSRAPTGPMNIASSAWPGYEPLYLGRDLGLIDQSSYKINELPSSNITMAAFENHSADIATLTLDETLTLLSQGRKAKILLVMDISNGGDAVLASPDIKSLADLKGKRIAIVNIPLGAYMLTRTLEKAGLATSDVTIVPLPENSHEKAYRAGKIDVAISFEPFKTSLIKAGMHVLFDSSNIPNEIFDVLVVQDDVYENRRGELCQLAKQWFKTLEYINTHPDESSQAIARRNGVTEQEYGLMAKGVKIPSREENNNLLGGKDPTILAPTKRLAEIMMKEHLLLRPIDPTLAIDSDFQSCI